jgi:hypothetical protein
MRRSMVGLLAAVGAAMAVFAALVVGSILLVIFAIAAGVATGLAAYMALPSPQEKALLVIGEHVIPCDQPKADLP